MNYYNPNLYQSYPYNGNNQFLNSYQQPQQAQQFFQGAQPSQQNLNGKIVDTVDMVKVTEVPIGGYGIFPKADLSEIYLKTWNPNGTTNILTFKPSFAESISTETEKNNTVIEILQKISNLESKIDTLFQPQEKKKEINANDY